MLDLAINHKENLQKKYFEFASSKKARLYFSQPSINYLLEIDDSNGIETHLVSVSNGEVVGYFSYKYFHVTNSGYDLSIICFKKDPEFFKDFFRLFEYMFKEHKLNKVVFNIILGHPAEVWYDWCCNEINGRIIGIFKEDVRLIDNTLADIKYYEVIAREWLEVVETRSLTCDNYLRGWAYVNR
jgi:hypothetical protein